MPTIDNTGPSFALTKPGTGKAIIPVGTANDVGFAMTLQADGKILVASSISNGGYRGYTGFSVIRLNADGTLDTSFSGDGKSTIDVDGKAASEVEADLPTIVIVF